VPLRAGNHVDFDFRQLRKTLQQRLRGRAEPRIGLVIFPVWFAVVGGQNGDFHLSTMLISGQFEFLLILLEGSERKFNDRKIFYGLPPRSRA